MSFPASRFLLAALLGVFPGEWSQGASEDGPVRVFLLAGQSNVEGQAVTEGRNFESESRRRPNFTLHELAHAYHERVLSGGFDQVKINTLFEQAKAGGEARPGDPPGGPGTNPAGPSRCADPSPGVFR